MILDKEKELVKLPLEKLTIKDLEPKTVQEYFIDDPSLIKEYKDLHKPFKQRLKYTAFWDILWFLGIVLYSKNIGYYQSLYLPNRKKGMGSLMFLSLAHCLAFMTTLAAGNCLILGINPVSFWKKSKDLNARMVENDPYKASTWVEFMLIYSEIEEVEEKKKKLRNELKKLTCVEQNKAL